VRQYWLYSESSVMKTLVINKSFGEFYGSHPAFLRLRELGQPEAHKEPDPGAY